jgi:hypothetical protein
VTTPSAFLCDVACYLCNTLRRIIVNTLLHPREISGSNFGLETVNPDGGVSLALSGICCAES